MAGLSVVEGIANVGNNSLGIGQFFSMSVLIYMTLIVIMGVLSYKIVQMLGYNIAVEILTKRGGGNIKIIKDKGKYMKDIDGTTKFQLMKQKEKMKPPSKSFLFLVKTLLGYKEKMVLVETDSGILLPIYLETGKVNQLTPDDIDTHFWMAQASRTAVAAYDTKTWFEKHGALITIGGVAIFAIFVIIYMGDYVTSQTQQNLAVQRQIADAIGSALTMLRGTPPPIP